MAALTVLALAGAEDVLECSMGALMRAPLDG
jgi:hypothetical protein